ncbi:hypothetical protein O181_011366 [Austropuccinia psidii MF-1]|uniref:Uncharacterized protein n=1 Tax=Austropuccinia psidii MF-1 TaxID=1389203 RepID=A0A9Q3BVM4_9BASI|nr:hypothetical protein [Austropuccinia psidii MF-1]
MTIVHKSENTNKNADGLSRLTLTNTPENPDYVPANAEPQIIIEVINVTDVGTEFFEDVGESYKKDKNFHILISLHENNCKDTALDSYSDDIWKPLYENGRFHLFYGILYHKSKQTCVMVLCNRMLISTISLEFHCKIYS